MSDVVVVALIGSVPLLIPSIAAVTGAINARRAVRETKTNGGGSRKDDLQVLRMGQEGMRSCPVTLQGTVGVMSDMLLTHATNAELNATAARVLIAEDLATAKINAEQVADPTHRDLPEGTFVEKFLDED